jgi:hypothetical protein
MGSQHSVHVGGGESEPEKKLPKVQAQVRQRLSMESPPFVRPCPCLRRLSCYFLRVEKLRQISGLFDFCLNWQLAWKDNFSSRIQTTSVPLLSSHPPATTRSPHASPPGLLNQHHNHGVRRPAPGIPLPDTRRLQPSRSLFLRVCLAGTSATRAVHHVRDTDVGDARSGDLHDVCGPDGLRGTELWAQALDKGRETTP